MQLRRLLFLSLLIAVPLLAQDSTGSLSLSNERIFALYGRCMLLQDAQAERLVKLEARIVELENQLKSQATVPTSSSSSK